MSNVTNKGRQLYKMFSELSGRPGNKPATEIWYNFFRLDYMSGPDHNIQIEIFKRLGRLMQHIEEVENIILNIGLSDGDVETHLRYFPNLKQVVAHSNLDHQWQSVVDHRLAPQVLQSLASCGTLLSMRHYDENIVDEEKLKALQEKIKSLKEELHAAGFRRDIEKMFVKTLDEMELTIRDYEFYGIDGLVEALKNSIFEQAFSQADISGDDKKKKGFKAKFLEAIKEAQSVVVTAMKDETKKRLPQLIFSLGYAGAQQIQETFKQLTSGN